MSEEGYCNNALLTAQDEVIHSDAEKQVECTYALQAPYEMDQQWNSVESFTIVNINEAKNVYNNCTIYNGKPLPNASTDDMLRKQAKRLKHDYREYNMSSLLWHDDSNDLPLDEYFVPVTVDEDSFIGKFSVGEIIQLEDIFFTEKKGVKRTKYKILIRGNPGYGKSTLIRKLAYDWATLRSPNYLDEFDIVLMIPLVNLGVSTIQEAAVKRMFGNNEPSKLVAIQQTQLKFLILLDGFDEMFNSDTVLRFLDTDKVDDFSLNATVVVTSRPYAVRGNVVWKKFERHLSVAGFSKENQTTYVNKMLLHKPKEKENMLEKLKDQFFSDLLKCPLMLHMFCCLENGTNTGTVSNLTSLYVELIRLLIVRYTRKHSNIPVYKGNYFTGEHLIQRLGKLAFLYFKPVDKGKPITVISKDTLREEFHSNDEFEFVTGLDILIPTPTTNDGSTQLNYDFIHRTIAEFLSVFYITKLPNVEELVLEFYNQTFLFNSLPVICFFFSLLGEEILKPQYESILERFSNILWEADWIYRFKNEVSQTTWDILFLRRFIKKLSCHTHNFTSDEIWSSLKQHLEVVKVNIDLTVDLGNRNNHIRKVMGTIQSCKYLKTLTIELSHCPQFQISYDGKGNTLHIDLRFIMDDLITISSLELLKNFHIDLGNQNLNNSNLNSVSEKYDHLKGLTSKNEQIYGLHSKQMHRKEDMNVVLLNVDKMEFTLTYEAQEIVPVILVVSEDQFHKLTREPFSYPVRETINLFLKLKTSLKE